MSISRQTIDDICRGAHASVSVFTCQQAPSEYHLMVQCTDPMLSAPEQMSCVCQACDQAAASMPHRARVVFKRYFLSDPANQCAMLPESEACAVSVLGQAPLNGTKVAIWAVFIEDAQVEQAAPRLWTARSGQRTYAWLGTASAPGMDSRKGTRKLLDDYDQALGRLGMSLADNCMRTWFFVRDIDVNYHGVVVGRNESFADHGLSAHTHFIASTGIGADSGIAAVPVVMDAYAISGLKAADVKYLKAHDFLNDTIEYGVSFERGTAIDLDHHRLVLISGTASIDNRGQVLHVGDVRRQAERMLQNVEALLAEGGASWRHVMHIIVYLRDIADYQCVVQLMRSRFPDMPMVIVQAPVCRPGWLIEMECAALLAKN